MPSAAKLFKTLLLLILCGLIAGVAGILTLILMYWMTHQSVAIDHHEKHGISHQKASRLGGIAVAFCAFCLYWISVGMEVSLERVEHTLLQNPFTYGLIIGFIGFCDDICGHLSAKVRIVLTTVVFAAFLLINPSYIPDAIGVPGIDFLLIYQPVALLLCLIGCLGMLNASNMADGANGLMPLVFLGSFFGYFLITGDLLYFTLTMGLMVFTLFNVLFGRLFLGDAGAYGFGAIAALGAIKIMAETSAEAWFFLCLAGYPVIDFFVSCVRRIVAGKSPLSADSDHMHNRLYRFVRCSISSPLVANSMSGLAISIGTTGVAVILLNWWPTNSGAWPALFTAQLLIYLAVFKLLSSGSHGEISR